MLKRPDPWRSRSLILPALLLILAGCSNNNDKRHWLGINTFTGAGVEGQWMPSGNDSGGSSGFLLISELGFPRMREIAMCWAVAQPSPEADYDWTYADDIVRGAQDAGIDVLALCWGVPAWAASSDKSPQGNPQAGLPAREQEKAFLDFVRAFVDRYNGDGKNDMPKLKQPIRAYEFMNRTEDYPVQEYAWWLKRFYQTVRQAAPEAIVVLGSLESPGVRTFDRPEGDYHTWFERLLAEPELQGAEYPCFDAVGFHNFPERYPGRQPFAHAAGYLRQTMADRNLDKPVWLTQFGYNSGAREESLQADYLVCWSIRARALGIERAYLYTLRDYRIPGERGPGQNYGLIRETGDQEAPPRKPAFQAMQRLLLELEERPRVTRQGEGFYKLIGRGDPVYVLWKKENQYDPSDMLIPGWWEVRTLTGRSTVRQGTEIELSASPMFLRKVTSPFLH